MGGQFGEGSSIEDLPLHIDLDRSRGGDEVVAGDLGEIAESSLRRAEGVEIDRPDPFQGSIFDPLLNGQREPEEVECTSAKGLIVDPASSFSDGTQTRESGGPRKGRGEELEPSRVEEGAVPPSKLFPLAEVTDEKAEAGDFFKEGDGGWGLHGAARRIRRQGD
jgi:hypothetical protein